MIFPLNYFTTIFSPVKIFKNRNQLSWGQIPLIILLLNALMLMPLSVLIGNTRSANLSDYVPNTMATINEQFVDHYNQYITGGKVIILPEQQNEFFMSDFAKAKEEILTKENRIIITNEGFLIKERNKPLIEQQFIEGIALTTANSIDDLVQQLSNHWFKQNRIAIVMTNFINIWLLMMINFVTLLCGTALLFWLTRFGKIFTIRTFFESFQLSLNAFGLPTLIAMLVGFIVKSPNAIILSQSTLYILLLLWVYWKTHFNDHYVEQLNMNR